MKGTVYLMMCTVIRSPRDGTPLQILDKLT